MKLSTRRADDCVKKATCLTGILMAGIFIVGVEEALAVPITLQEGTATHSAGGSFSPDASIDGNVADNPGWAIHFAFGNQTAVWETATDVNATQLDFKLHQAYSAPSGQILGRFRLSVTSDDRSSFADGLDTGGDVTANWAVLTSPTVSGTGGVTFQVLGDNSMLASNAPGTSIYDIQYTGSFVGITGIRLEALEHASLPFNGPGTSVSNGNFVLTEIQLDASTSGGVPEPFTLLLLGTGLLGLVSHGRRKRVA